MMQRAGDGELHLAQQPRFGHAHAACALDDRRVDLADRGEAEHEDGRQREHDQRDRARACCRGRARYADDEDGERRDGPSDVRQVDRRRGAGTGSGRAARRRHRDDAAISSATDRDDEVLEDAGRDPLGALPVERVVEPHEHVVEEAHVVVLPASGPWGERALHADQGQVDATATDHDQHGADEQRRVEEPSSPSKISCPSPPWSAPRMPATGRRPTVVTVAMRRPPMITGSANGTSTRQSRCRQV